MDHFTAAGSLHVEGVTFKKRGRGWGANVALTFQTVVLIFNTCEVNEPLEEVNSKMRESYSLR